MKVIVITNSHELPDLTSRNFFHSLELFRIMESTPGLYPLMALALDNQQRVKAHLLASLQRKYTLLPPFYFTQARILGEGEYAHDCNPLDIFPLLLHAILQKLRFKFCISVELSDMSKKMFGYRALRQHSFFPIAWQEVHNSLHSLSPYERLLPKTRYKIHQLNSLHIETTAAHTLEEVRTLHRIIKKYYRWRIHKLIPPKQFLEHLHADPHSKIYITRMNGKIVGGCTCILSDGSTYLWHLAASPHRHSTAIQTSAVWKALNDSHKLKQHHFYFLDAGLPLKSSRHRDFIMGFGGKPVAKYRWFRLSIGWLNRLISWLYRE